MNTYIGIDYSMTSPSICVNSADETFSFHYLTSSKKFEGRIKMKDGWEMTGHPMPSWSSSEQRYDAISDWALTVIKNNSPENQPKFITIEGYAMGAKGQVFNIAENTGLLKHKLWTAGESFLTPAPSAVKKMATSKGNADKQKMEDAFKVETSLDVKAMLGMTPSQWNPSSDIIDSYFLSRWSKLNSA